MAVVNPQPSDELTDDDKLWALLCWVFPVIVPVIVLLLEDKKDRLFVKYNAIQSLALAVAALVISGLLSFVFCIGGITGVAWLGYSIYLAIQSYQGKWVTIPVVTDFCVNQGWIARAP
jgi:uncharacterized protein